MGALNSHWFKRLGGGALERFGLNLVSRLHLLMLGTHKETDVIRLLRRVRKERVSLLTGNETFLIYALARAYAHLPYPMAEVGVYQGVSAKLICEAKGDTRLHLFDTFAGLPSASETDDGVHRSSQYSWSLDAVRDYLHGYPNLCFHQGLFPESADGLEKQTYSLVHIDVDLYSSTKACLEYFYPQLMPGGVLISHDYSILSGVKTAFHEFLADKPEKLIELPTTQGMIVKLGMA